jgi:hypothetical protein
MTKNRKTVREFIEVLGELYGAPAAGPRPAAPRTGTAAPAETLPADSIPPEHHDRINYIRLARVFADTTQEESQVAIGIRRFLMDQHLTLEMKDLLLGQFRKLLMAAQNDRSVMIRLEQILHPTKRRGMMPQQTNESAGIAMASLGSRLARILMPKNANAAKLALDGLKSGERLPLARIQTLMGLMGSLIEVIEQHPDLLDTLQAKVRATTPAVTPVAGTPPAAGTPGGTPDAA